MLTLLQAGNNAFPAIYALPLWFLVFIVFAPVFSAVANSTIFSLNFTLPARINQNIGLYALSISFCFLAATGVLIFSLFIESATWRFAFLLYCAALGLFMSYWIDKRFGHASFIQQD